MSKVFIIAAILLGFTAFVYGQSIGQFYGHDYLIQDSGMPEIFSNNSKTVNLQDISIKKEELSIKDNFTVTLGVGALVVEDPKPVLKAFINPNTSSIVYSGLKAMVYANCHYVDQFGVLEQEFEGNATIFYNFTELNLNVSYSVKEGKPVYNVDVTMAIQYVAIQISNGDELVKADFEKYAIPGYVDQLVTGLKPIYLQVAQAFYKARADKWENQYVYIDDVDIIINTTIVDFKVSEKGFQYLQDGRVNPKPAGKEKVDIDEIDLSRGQAQTFYTKEFITMMSAVPAYVDFFNWTMTEQEIEIPGFDFRMADLWVIFPESRKAPFKASDRTVVVCKGDKNKDPAVEMDEKHQQIKVDYTSHCTVKHREGDHIHVEFDYTAKFFLDPIVRIAGVVDMKVYDTQIIEVKNIQSAYAFGKREEKLINLFLKSALEIYAHDQDIFGSGYKILPSMDDCAFYIRKNTLFMFGEHPDFDWSPRQNKLVVA